MPGHALGARKGVSPSGVSMRACRGWMEPLHQSSVHGSLQCQARGEPCSPWADWAFGVCWDQKKHPLLYLERSCSRIFLSQLYSELIVHIFYPAVKTCEDCVYAPVDIGNLIRDFRESGNFLDLWKEQLDSSSIFLWRKKNPNSPASLKQTA